MKVGLDVGGTKIEAVAVDGALRIVGRIRIPTGWGPDAVTRTVVEAVHALGTEAGVDLAEVRSVGVGIPGQIHAGSGRVVHAVNLGVEELDLVAAVEPRLRVPVRIENDVKAAALGAFRAVGGRDYARVDVMVTADGEPVVLEVNTLPGMTATSLLPQSARAAGIEFPDLCERICRTAQLGRLQEPS